MEVPDGGVGGGVLAEAFGFYEVWRWDGAGVECEGDGDAGAEREGLLEWAVVPGGGEIFSVEGGWVGEGEGIGGGVGLPWGGPAGGGGW